MPTPARAAAPRTVAVTGASGFVGRHVVEALTSRGWTVRGLVRDVEKARTLLPTPRPLERSPAGRVVAVQGDVFDRKAVADLVAGADAVVHLIGIRREQTGGVTYQRLHVEATSRMLEAASGAGVRRYVHMSALGARADAPGEYHRTKHEAEQLVRASGLDWTILRPSIIHGPDGEFMQMARGWVTGEAPPYKFLPYFFSTDPDSGEAIPGRLQPVHVDDVARALADAIENPAASGEIYPLGGPDAFDWPTMLVAVRDVIPGAKPKLKPLGLHGEFISTVAHAAKAIGLGQALPFGPDEPLMGVEDNTSSIAKARAHLGFNPRPFVTSLREYAGAI